MATKFDRRCTRRARLWVLGEKLQAEEVKDAAVDAMIDGIYRTSTPPFTPHQLIHPNNIGWSGARKLCVDVAAQAWTHTTKADT